MSKEAEMVKLFQQWQKEDTGISAETQRRADCFDELVAALKLYIEVGDQCSRGYLAQCEKSAKAALAKAEAVK